MNEIFDGRVLQMHRWNDLWMVLRIVVIYEINEVIEVFDSGLLGV